MPPAMRRIAVFGNAGGGKSTFARRLAEVTGLPLHVTDILQFEGGRFQPSLPGGGKLSPEAYARLHDDILARDAWIIDGFESFALAWKRFEAADTLIHIDLPVALHYWGVTKRLAQGLLGTPGGWPPGAPVLASSISSYRVVWPCHRHLTPRYRALAAEMPSKALHRLTSRAEMARFLRDLGAGA